MRRCSAGIRADHETLVWDTLLENITFGLYEAPETKVKIESNIQQGKIYYYVDQSGDTKAKSKEELEEVVWLKYQGEFSLPKGKSVVYAKLVDVEQGRYYYLCSDGVITPTATPTFDSKGATYKVLSQKSGNATVEYVESNGKKNVTVPKVVVLNNVAYNVTRIADKAFCGNKKVTNISMGNNITKIGEKAFKNASGLKKVKLSKNITSIGAQAFEQCKNLKEIIVHNRNLKAKELSKNAFKGISKDTVIKVPSGKVAAYKKLFRRKGLSKKVKVKEYS